MNSIGILSLGIIPLLIFVILKKLFGLNAGVIGAILMALMEVALSYYFTGSLDWITGAAVLVFLITGWYSYRYQSALQIKFQPVIISAGLGLMMIISYLMDKPLMYEMAMKYQDAWPEQVQLQLSSPFFQAIIQEATFTGGIGLMTLAAMTAFAALKWGDWGWLLTRGIGLYVILFIAMLAAQFSVMKKQNITPQQLQDFLQPPQ